MKMKIGIHQPNYLPYLGFFDKMKRSDLFIIYDDAQFNKEDFQHRNRIRIFHGWKWLTVPIKKRLAPIDEIRIMNEFMIKGIKWSDLHLKIIKDNYNNTPFYSTYQNNLESIYNNNYEKLIDLNIGIINFLKDAFDIKTELIFSSKLGFTSRSTQRLVDMVDSLGGDVYLSGPMGRDYLDNSLFEKKGIEVEFQDFKHPIYKQRYEGFVPNMSSIDALFNIGEMPKSGV